MISWLASKNLGLQSNIEVVVWLGSPASINILAALIEDKLGVGTQLKSLNGKNDRRNIIEACLAISVKLKVFSTIF